MQPDTAPTLTWRPIESAPKDGTPILAFSPDDDFRALTGIDVIWWEAVEECWFFGMSNEYQPMNPPTHWMPLPPPPSETPAQPTACTECERLAEALEDIADHETDCPSMTATEAMEHTLCEIRDKARFALASHTVRLIDGAPS